MITVLQLESNIQNTWLQKFGENVNQIYGNKYVFKLHQ